MVYSTYLGGSKTEEIRGIAVDESGVASLAGFTFSTDFPTVNTNQGILQGVNDVFVTQLSSSGNSLLFSTYFGGSSNE